MALSRAYRFLLSSPKMLVSMHEFCAVFGQIHLGYWEARNEGHTPERYAGAILSPFGCLNNQRYQQTPRLYYAKLGPYITRPAESLNKVL